MKSFYVVLPEGVSLSVQVKPGSTHPGLGGVAGERLRIKVAAGAVEGQANEALRELLSAILHVPKSSITITRGATARNKTVMVRGEPQALVKLLESQLSGGRDT
ncbi:MAG TPA: DUF167 domain-containing protein [Candidatus Obscuribacterales bacterium]